MDNQARATRLDYADERLLTLDWPKAVMRVTRGLGSGLSRAHGDTSGRFWAIGDRGPNLKVKLAVERYGLTEIEAHRTVEGAKVMPCLDIGPALVELRLEGHCVTLVRVLPLLDADGRPLTGLPIPGGTNIDVEPAIGADGAVLPPDPGGVDSEGLAVAADGSFWVGDEYGPSLLHVAPDGRVIERWVPRGSAASFVGARYPVVDCLPAIAATRQLNRGFEALALARDGQSLHLAFQSPLAHPDAAAHRAARHVRLWTLATEDGRLLAEYLYPLDPPGSFRRDVAKGAFDRSDIKVSELAVDADDRLLMLERGSETTKLYRVSLSPDCALDAVSSDVDACPTLEQRSADGTLGNTPVLTKRLLISTDDLPEVGADLEGMLILDDRTILLVNDNDFGIEGVATEFWRITLAEPLA